MKLTPLFLLLTLFGNASASGGSCACEAEELGFTIDCADTNAMLDALAFLNANACSADCSSEECEKNFYIVQAHHDFCPEEGIPEAIEDGFHDFDEVCTHCGIARPFVEGAPTCPTPNCDDNSGNDAYTNLVENGCNIDCSSDTCRDLFFLLRITHDACEHDTLSTFSEEGLHDLEVPCADQICNDPAGGASQLICDEDEHDEHDHHDDHDSHDDHDEDHDSHDEESGVAGSVATTATGVAAVLGSAILMAA